MTSRRSLGVVATVSVALVAVAAYLAFEWRSLARDVARSFRPRGGGR